MRLVGLALCYALFAVGVMICGAGVALVVMAAIDIARGAL